MRTIHLHNWLSVGAEFKKVSQWILLATVGVLGLFLLTEKKYMVYGFVSLISTIPFTIPIVVQRKDKMCQWERFSFTMPISRKDVVAGHFRFFTEITGIYFAFTTLFFGLSVVLTHSFAFEYPVTVRELLFFLPFVLSMGLFGQSLRYITSLIGQDSLSEMLQIVVIGLSCMPCVALYYLFGMPDTMTKAVIYGVLTLVLIVFLTVIAFLVAVKLMENKEF